MSSGAWAFSILRRALSQNWPQLWNLASLSWMSRHTALNDKWRPRWLTGTSLSKGNSLRTALTEGMFCILPPERLSGYSGLFAGHFWQESCVRGNVVDRIGTGNATDSGNIRVDLKCQESQAAEPDHIWDLFRVTSHKKKNWPHFRTHRIIMRGLESPKLILIYCTCKPFGYPDIRILPITPETVYKVTGYKVKSLIK